MWCVDEFVWLSFCRKSMWADVLGLVQESNSVQGGLPCRHGLF